MVLHLRARDERRRIGAATSKSEHSNYRQRRDRRDAMWHHATNLAQIAHGEPPYSCFRQCSSAESDNRELHVPLPTTTLAVPKRNVNGLDRCSIKGAPAPTDHCR